MEAKRRLWCVLIFSSLMLASSCGNQFWRQTFPRPRFPWLQPASSFPNFNFDNVSNAPFEVIRAEVDLVPAAGSGVTGRIFLSQELPGNSVTITGQINGLKPGLHGFHIHNKGDLGDDCKNAGPHFNPFNEKHGAPFSFTRHVGDLGNVRTSSSLGIASFTLRDSKISLRPNVDNSIAGLALVIHDGEDDLGFGGDEESLKTGNAGTRVGCGIIRVLP